MRWLRASAVCGLALAFGTACSDGGPTAPDGAPDGAPGSELLASSSDACETITFDAAGVDHGESPSPLSVLGLSIAVSGTRYVDPSGNFGGAITPLVFDTDIQSAIEDVDLQVPPAGLCAACAGLHNILVLPDERGFAFWGDYRWGGTMTLSGFSGGQFYVKQFAAVDDDAGEPPISLWADGTQIGASSGLGNATVEVVTTSQTLFTGTLQFRMGTVPQDAITGSGGVDDIVVCRVVPPPTNPGTRTQGYWKNHPEAWPVQQITIGGVVYSQSQAIAIMKQPVAGDKRYNMFEQLVAAKLNVLVGNDGSCVAQTIADADAWMAARQPFPGGTAVPANSPAWQSSGSALHTTLDRYNNGQLCAPKAT